MSSVKKVVLAYSGGLDTSVIVRWLQETYRCEVVTFTADIGQGEEVEPARDQLLFNGLGALHAQDLVEAPRTLLIGIALEQDAPIPLAREEFRVSLQGGLAVIG